MSTSASHSDLPYALTEYNLITQIDRYHREGGLQWWPIRVKRGVRGYVDALPAIRPGIKLINKGKARNNIELAGLSLTNLCLSFNFCTCWSCAFCSLIIVFVFITSLPITLHDKFDMFFSKASAVALVSFLQFLTVSGAPIIIRAAQSPSLASLSQPVLSPYYLYFGNPSTAKLADAFDSAGLRAATLGFASAPKQQCSLTSDLDDLAGDAQTFIAKGGALSISFGGNLQNPAVPRQHVQQACTAVSDLASLIKGAMDKFGTHNIEFDIEDNDLLSDLGSANRLAQALVQVKNEVSDTFVTYTVGANPSGMPGPQNAYVQAAQSNGLNIDVLTLMTMNMGGSNVVSDAQSAITGAAAQLETIYQLQKGQGIKKMGILPAIGVDNTGQLIDVAGSTTIATFAKSQGLHTLSYWSFNRDFPGDAGSSTQSLDDSSSPDQNSPSQFLTTMASALSAGSSGKPSIQEKLSLFSKPASQLSHNDTQPGQKQSLPAFNSGAAPQGAIGSAGLNGTASTNSNTSSPSNVGTTLST